MGEGHYELFYKAAYKASGLEYENARRDKFVPVLITDSLDVLVQPIATELGIEHVICNRLEFSSGKATGRLLSPISTGRVSGQQLNEWRKVAIATWRLSWIWQSGDGYALVNDRTTMCRHPRPRPRSIAQDLNWPSGARMTQHSWPQLKDVFAGKRIVVTGATGYGKGLGVMDASALSDLKELVLLIRPNKDHTAVERFETIAATSPVFRPIRDTHGDQLGPFLNARIQVIAADISQPFAGLTEDVTTSWVRMRYFTLQGSRTSIQTR